MTPSAAGGGREDQALLVSIPEAARRLGVSRTQFYRLIAAGHFRVLKIGARALISVPALRAYHDALVRQAG